jgi:hypothetical protein
VARVTGPGRPGETPGMSAGPTAPTRYRASSLPDSPRSLPDETFHYPVRPRGTLELEVVDPVDGVATSPTTEANGPRPWTRFHAAAPGPAGRRGVLASDDEIPVWPTGSDGFPCPTGAAGGTRRLLRLDTGQPRMSSRRAHSTCADSVSRRCRSFVVSTWRTRKPASTSRSATTPQRHTCTR